MVVVGIVVIVMSYPNDVDLRMYLNICISTIFSILFVKGYGEITVKEDIDERFQSHQISSNNIMYHSSPYLDEVQKYNEQMVLHYEAHIKLVQNQIKEYQKILEQHYEQLQQVHDALPVWVQYWTQLNHRGL